MNRKEKGASNQSEMSPKNILDHLIIVPVLLVKIGDLAKRLMIIVFNGAYVVFVKTTGLLTLGLLKLARLFLRILGSIIWKLSKNFSRNLRSIINSLRSFLLKQRNSLRSFFLTEIELTLPKIKIPFPKLSPATKSFILGVIFTLLFFFIPFQAYSWLMALPHPKILSLGASPVTTKIYDRNGFLLYEIYLEQNRTPVSAPPESGRLPPFHGASSWTWLAVRASFGPDGGNHAFNTRLVAPSLAEQTASPRGMCAP